MTAVYGILFLFLFPFIFFSEKKEYIRILKISGITSFILIMPFALVPRYFLVSFLLLSIPIVSGVANIIKKFQFIQKYMVVITVFLILSNLTMQITLQEYFFQGFSYLKVQSKNNNKNMKYLYTLPYYRAVEFLNNIMSDNEKVLFLGEDRSFYMKKKFYLSSFNDNNKVLDIIKKNNDYNEILTKIKKDNITYVLFSEHGLERMSKMSIVYKLSKKNKDKLLLFLSNQKLIFQDRMYKIYKLNENTNKIITYNN